MSSYMDSIFKQFKYYKQLGDKTLERHHFENLINAPDGKSNSLAVMVNHISGNMLSRWTDFLTSDGEKEWRNRDAEFEQPFENKEELLEAWEKGWTVLFQAIEPLTDDDMNRIVYIRNQGHTVSEAINRQLAHYAYHIGQIVYLGRLLAEHWESLSIPKGKSSQFNKNMFDKDKSRGHFTDELLEK